MEQHFRPTMADPGYDVVTENRYFVTGADVEWEELSFSVNGSTWGADRPPFPLLQPEKVLSLPLLLRFDEGYRYRLDGTARVDGYDCYVVRFEPLRGGCRRSIPARSGSTARRSRGSGCRRCRAGWRRRSSPTRRSSVHAAGHGRGSGGLSVQRPHLPADHADRRPEPSGREEASRSPISGSTIPASKDAREAARSSDHVMFRETEPRAALLRQAGRHPRRQRPRHQEREGDGDGRHVDPSFAFPLPILGHQLPRLRVRSPDSQLALLFAGVLAAGNIQRPKLGSTPLDASIDFFAHCRPLERSRL